MEEINTKQEFKCICGCKFVSTDWYYLYRHNKKIMAEICPECIIVKEAINVDNKY